MSGGKRKHLTIEDLSPCGRDLVFTDDTCHGCPFEYFGSCYVVVASQQMGDDDGGGLL